MSEFEVIVIGGGHAGCEAAAAAARMGAKSLLITYKLENLGEMSCNPSIGGVAKGIIVKEIDALDGIMARAIDKAGIHYKMLNETKGPAVWGPRAQADRKLYKKAVLDLMLTQKNLTILEDEVIDILIDPKKEDGYINRITGVNTKRNGKFLSSKVILTAGTFLSGLIEIGENRYSSGRMGESACETLVQSMLQNGFKTSRLRTGTPARLLKDSINFGILEEQKGDEVPRPFSYMVDEIKVPQISCYITHTNLETDKVIRSNIHLSAAYKGEEAALAPRYCPSVDTKIVKFPQKKSHQIFLEPEGLDSNLIYPNGMSTSLPENVQEKFLRTIKGLENVKMVKPGYVIAYDFFDPRDLYHTLETKQTKGLYFAGQINGTTGYEEAGCQGLMAGINAVCSYKNKSFVLSRSDAYIGVLIDDLITNGCIEPYRMFTSRAEYRMMLRADNADLRLTQIGYEIGCVSVERYKRVLETKGSISEMVKCFEEQKFLPKDLEKAGIKISKDGVKRDLYDLLSYPKITLDDVRKIFS